MYVHRERQQIYAAPGREVTGLLCLPEIFPREAQYRPRDEMSQYITNFTNNASILEDYDAPEDALDGATVHLAWYGYGDYCGSSLVIFERNGKLYEVNGSHCSCFGLERQWKPEETSWDALSGYDLRGAYDGSREAHESLQELVYKHRGRKLIASKIEGRLIRETDA